MADARRESHHLSPMFLEKETGKREEVVGSRRESSGLVFQTF
jgi:hypothetical protein